MVVSRKDDVQEVQVSREGRTPGATVAVERTWMYLQRTMKLQTAPGWNMNARDKQQMSSYLEHLFSVLFNQESVSLKLAILNLATYELYRGH